MTITKGNNMTDNTEAAAKTELAVQAVTTSVASFQKVADGIADIAKAHPVDLVVADIQTGKGMEAAIAGRAAWRTPRIELEKQRKAAKAPIIALGKELDAYAGTIEEQLRIGESNYDSQIKAEEDRKQAIKDERDRLERERVAVIESRLTAMRNLPLDAVGKSADELQAVIDTLSAETLEDFDEVYLPTAQQVRDGAMDALRRVHAERVQLDAQAEELAQAQAALAASQAQAAKEAAQREAEAQAIRAQEDAARAATQAAEDAQRAEQAAADQAERERINAEQAARQAELDAQQQAIADQRAADAQAAQDAADAAAQAELEAKVAAAAERRAAEDAARAAAVENATLREAAEVALDALENVNCDTQPNSDPVDYAIVMLKSALARDVAG